MNCYKDKLHERVGVFKIDFYFLNAEANDGMMD